MQDMVPGLPVRDIEQEMNLHRAKVLAKNTAGNKVEARLLFYRGK